MRLQHNIGNRKNFLLDQGWGKGHCVLINVEEFDMGENLLAQAPKKKKKKQNLGVGKFSRGWGGGRQEGVLCPGAS